MTKEQFLKHYKRLLSVYSDQFSSDVRRDLIWKYISDLSEKWWSETVDVMIITNNPRLNVQEAAKVERSWSKAYDRTNETIEAYKALMEQATEKGYQDALKSFGAKSLWDAVKNVKK